MESPAKEPINGWLQLNLAAQKEAVAALQQALHVRCKDEKYVDFAIHPISTILINS